MRWVLLGNGGPLQAVTATLRGADQEIVATGRHTDPAVRECDPDVGLCVGYRHLIDPDTLTVPRCGWFNIHSSLLPAYKGFAPVNWAILNGERRLGATLHVIDESVDGGDIVFQEAFTLRPGGDAGEALGVLNAIYRRLTRRLVVALETGDVPRTPMPPGDDRLWPARTDKDGEIDWTQSAEQIHRLVRAVAPPYQGAWTTCGDGRKLRILKAVVE